jgi:hypothetical protein|tara:strand:+ start:237 stop:1394 length:1158 start_codon:yes stop_codon:yes gene_type:complete
MDENLKQFCTPRQLEYLQAVEQYGSNNKASKIIGVDRRTLDRALHSVQIKAARSGYSPKHDMTHTAPEGFNVKGVSTLYDQDGLPKAQWVKTTADKEQQALAMREVIDSLLDELPKAKPTKSSLRGTVDELLVAYPVGDAHFGMLAWDEECGNNFDIKIAESDLCGAMDYLVKYSPEATEAAILILGDFMHYDGMAPVTPAHGHLLDADSRFPQVVRAAMRSIRYLVSAALKKHTKVKLIIEIGNHDLSSAIFLMETFHMFFEHEPRVDVDRSPMNLHAFKFGKNLIATTHGDKIKMDKVIPVIAEDFRGLWSGCPHVYVHTGHVHHDHIKEQVGGMVESHGILTPKDSYASKGGWRAKQSMKSITYHVEHGEVGRQMVTPQMLK